MTAVRIALVGDHNPDVLAHRAIPEALRLAAARLGATVEGAWVGTDTLELEAGRPLSPYAGLWCVPGSPYASTAGALAAIRHAREWPLPFLGTCGGFQHALLEFARNVLGLAEAEHAETHPDAAVPLIAPLSCSLVERSGVIALSTDSRLRRIYGTAEVGEAYHCRYGLNPRYEPLLADGPLRVCGRDAAGEVRAVELDDHPFFVATLFQPERAALRGASHPLVEAFVAAAAGASSCFCRAGEAATGRGRC
jgi:CTP synthase (UTP-ammonia lyase)